MARRGDVQIHNRRYCPKAFSHFFLEFLNVLYCPRIGQICHCNPRSRMGKKQGRKKEKSPQGYDEDNASLDKFCKIKAKRRNTRSTNCRGEEERISATQAPGLDIIHESRKRNKAQQHLPPFREPNLPESRMCVRGGLPQRLGVVYRIKHLLLVLPPRPPLVIFSRAARVAASKTSLTPSLVRAEHSRYL